MKASDPCLYEPNVHTQLLSAQDGIPRVGGGLAVLSLARFQTRRVAAPEQFGEPLLPPQRDPMVHVPDVSQGSLVFRVRNLTEMVLFYLISKSYTEMGRIIPIIGGRVAASLPLSATACQSAIFGKFDRNYRNLAGTILHISVHWDYVFGFKSCQPLEIERSG